jgi:hypothetical protein
MVITVPEEFVVGAGDAGATGAVTTGAATTGAVTAGAATTVDETGAATGDGELVVAPSAITASSAPTATVWST